MLVIPKNGAELGPKGSITNGKKHGFFHEGIWHGRSTRRSDGIFYAGNYRNGLKVGLHGRCYYAQAGRTDFQIGNYNSEGKPEGVWEILTLGMIVFRKTRMGIMKRFIVLAAM